MEKHRPKYIKFLLSRWDYKKIYVCKYCGEKIAVKETKRKKYMIIEIIIGLIISAVYGGLLNYLVTYGYIDNVIEHIGIIVAFLTTFAVLNVFIYYIIPFDIITK